jgi:nitroreductase
MILEETLWRRSSIRNFTSEPVSIEDLSTLLWAAYGVRGDGSRTIAPVNGVYAVRIYVLLADAVYYYEPANHSLVSIKVVIIDRFLLILRLLLLDLSGMNR